MRMLKRFLSDKSGATAIEYSLVAGLIAAVIVDSLRGDGVHAGRTLMADGAGLRSVGQ